MTTNTRRPCAATTRAGRPCKNLVNAAHVFCPAHMPALTYDDASSFIRALHDIGMLKSDEQPKVVHLSLWCERRRNPSESCTCQEVQIVWPDFNQTRVAAVR